MNAYELADGLSKMYIETDNHGLFNKRIQNMIRQQADRIAELEDKLSMYEIQDLDRGIIGRTKDYAIHDLVHRNKKASEK